jgi:hypothetical protein
MNYCMRVNIHDFVQFLNEWKSKTGSLHSDFFLITSVGRVIDPVRPWDYVPVAIFVAMLLWVVIAEVDMVQVCD